MNLRAKRNPLAPAPIDTRIEKSLLALVFVVFAVIYGLISLGNHYYFRTYALDLGISNHALYDYAHFRMNLLTMGVTGAEPNFLGDHFSPIVMVYSPLHFLFGSYTLLLVQIAAILFGGWGIYRYAGLYHAGTYLPLLLVLHFFCVWGIYFALSFDFHNNVVAAMLVPWLVYHYQRENRPAFLIYFLLILICKENMALWLCFIVLGLLVKKWMEGRFRRKEVLKFELPLLAFTVAYFVFVVGVLMPHLTQGVVISQLDRYELLGHSLGEIVGAMFTRPGYVLSLFFENPLPNAEVNGVKAELHLMVLVSGGIFLLYRPYYLLMLVPIYAQKMFSSNPIIWGIGSQYSIEFVPILTLCLCETLAKPKSPAVKYGLAAGLVLLTAFFTYKKMENPNIQWYDKSRVAFYSGAHYRAAFDVKEMHRALKTVPADAVVSVSPELAPHMAFRRKIYQFPVVKDAEYLLLVKGSHYPLTEQEQTAKVNAYLNDPAYETVYDHNSLWIFKKR